jgi:hypothetical protein
MTKKIYRRWLLAAAMLLMTAALTITPTQREALAFGDCQYCASEYEFCMEPCSPYDENCRSKCDFGYHACLLTCEP